MVQVYFTAAIMFAAEVSTEGIAAVAVSLFSSLAEPPEHAAKKIAVNEKALMMIVFFMCFEFE